VILYMNFEELRALTSGAELVRDASTWDRGGAVAAPSKALAQTEALRSRLTGDISIVTLAEQRRVRDAVALICEHLRDRLESKVIEFNPGHDEAVDLYFDYAHSVTVLDRLDRLGAEMTAMVEVISGQQVTAGLAETLTFPD
jgi:hypothetical protein